jgi:hypothetical protein
MTTIIVDDDDVHWSWTPRDPKFIPPTIRELLAEEFSPEADFYVCDEQLYVVYPNLDYATDWSAYPIREVHPFYPVLHGHKISEAEFRGVVQAKHAI